MKNKKKLQAVTAQIEAIGKKCIKEIVKKFTKL